MKPAPRNPHPPATPSARRPRGTPGAPASPGPTPLASAPRTPVYLRPGDLFLGTEPSLVTTVLGSCVAVTMFNARLRMGGICHALLADPLKEGAPDGEFHGPYKYVSDAIQAMIDGFFRLGIHPAEIEVKLFGGANALSAGAGAGADGSVGQMNVRRARELLEQANLRPCKDHVGGLCGRKIVFDTFTGVVLLKRLPRPSFAAAPSHGPT